METGSRNVTPPAPSGAPRPPTPGEAAVENSTVIVDPATAPLTYTAIRAWVFEQLSTWVKSLRVMRAVVRLRPFEVDTVEGRSSERYRRAALTTLASFASRLVGVFTGLLWVRVSLAYLGRERYGLWMAVGSLVTWANLADLGLARGMQNHLSQANGEDDQELAGRYVSTGLLTLGTIALALAALCTPVLIYVPWAQLLNVRDPSLARETTPVVSVVLACLLVELPLSLVPTIFAAYQRGYIFALFSLAGSLLSAGTLLAVTQLHLELPWLILATTGSGIVMSAASFAYALKIMPWLRPRLQLATLTTLRALAGTSGALFVFQIGALLINETQSFIIARYLSLAEVTDWSILMRVYLIPATLIQLIDSPLIPAFREAHVRGERQWLRIAFWRVTKIKMAIAVLASGVLIVFGNRIASLLGGQSFHFSFSMWSATAFLLLVSVWNVSFNDLMISVDRLRLLVITLLVNGVITPMLSYLLAPRLGLLGVMMATPLFSFAVSAWLFPWACRDLVRDGQAPAN